MRNIGKNIKSLREEKKLSQEQLAEMLFVTRQTVSNYETGRSHPDIEMLTRIAEVLDVDANTIIYGTEPSPEQRSERKALIIAFVMTLVSGIVWFVSESLVQDYTHRYFDVAPQILLRGTILPAWLIILGWTLMQSSRVFLGAKQLKGKNLRLFRGILLTVLILWMMFVLPPLADTVRLAIIRWQWLQTHSSYSSTDFVLPDILQNLVWNPISSGLLLHTLKYCGIFPLFGIALWLADFPKTKHTVVDRYIFRREIFKVKMNKSAVVFLYICPKTD